MLRNFKKLFSADYKNSVVVGSVCLGARVQPRDPGQRWWLSRELDMRPDTDSHLPFALLGEEGWRKFDPFFPVEVSCGVLLTVRYDGLVGGVLHRGRDGRHDQLLH